MPLRLGTFPDPVVGLVPIRLDEANALLSEWGHYLGPCNRPFRNEGWALDMKGAPIALATSSSIVGETSAGYPKSEVVELIAAHARQHLDERVPAAAYLNLYALYEKERDRG